MISTSLPSSSSRSPSGRVLLDGASVRWTGRSEGDLGVTAGRGLGARRRVVQPGTWAWLRQVHGATVHVVDRPGGVRGADGDALVTATPGVILAVFSADCAPVALGSPEGVAAAAHAGWRGLEAGVLEATVAVMRDLGATSISAALGPCIRPGCYEFGERDLDRLERVLGPGVSARTAGGRPALDLPAAVALALGRAGAELVADHGGCTACGPGWFSHRGGVDQGRQATVVVARDSGVRTGHHRPSQRASPVDERVTTRP